MYCGEATGVNVEHDRLTAVTLYCRSWGCPDCAPTRRRALIAFAKSGNPDTFITLTVNPAWFGSPEERASRLAGAWRLVARKAARKYGYQHVPYLAVFEATQNGEPHLHVLARCRWIDQRWLSKKMAAAIGAPVVDIRRVRAQAQVAGYVAKYIGKAPHHFGTCKRYWCTRDYPGAAWVRERERRRGHGTWERWPRCLCQVVGYFVIRGGWKARREDDAWIMTRPSADRVRAPP